MSHYILGIETSCDDTSAAIISNRKILANLVANQKIHENYGGVVPELASRAHQQNIVPVVQQAIQVANINQNNLSAIAFTQGPGLLGSLLVGGSFAKSLSLALEVPLITVNHMEAHVLAHFIEDANEHPPTFPFICLTVSGGHTQLLQINDYFDFHLLGETLDDAVGEAFDKIGKLLGLPYPAGPVIDKLAKEGDPEKFSFSKPKVDDFAFSFSGIKTAVRYFLEKEMKNDNQFIENNMNDLCASIQALLVDILIDKIAIAHQKTGISQMAIAGGVSANSLLRENLKNWAEKNDCQCFIPKFEYTTDNAAMIALVGELKFERGLFADLSAKNQARIKFTTA